MSPFLHSRRFDLRWLRPVIGNDGADLLVAGRVYLSAGGASRNDLAGLQFDEPLEQFDEALEQIATEECRACPLCRAIAARS